MRSTMMDVPLTIGALMRYGVTAFGDHEVVTATADGTRRQTYRQTGTNAARLAGALRGLGIDGDQRVATLMWNNAEHLEAYLAVPSMGAVLHTLNLRLDPEQIGYIATHAGDEIVIVDGTLVPLLAQVLPHAPGIRHVIVTTPEGGTDEYPPAELTGQSAQVHSYTDLLAAAARFVQLARPGRAERRGDVLHERHDRATRRAWSTVTGPCTCTRWPWPWATCSRCPNRTGCCRSCRCSTPMPGACRTPPSWPART